MIVSADGFAESCIPLDLSPGEIRAMDVSLSKGATISGRVVRAGVARPDEVINVRLIPKARSKGRIAFLEDTQTVLSARTISADPTSGRFAFEHVASGKYLLQASASPTVHSEISEIVVSDGDAEYICDLALPATAFLHGHVVGAPGKLFDGVELMIVPNAFPKASMGVVGDLKWRRKLSVPLRSAATYEAGPLPTGDVVLSLVVPDVYLPNGFDGGMHTAGSAIDVGQVVLVPGDNEHDLDLRGIAPGTLRIDLSASGQSTSGLVAELCSVREKYLATQAGAVSDGGPCMRIGPVRAGDYVLTIRSLSSSWFWIASPSIKIIGGEETTFACELPKPIEGYLKVRMADAPLSVVSGLAMVRPDSTYPVGAVEALLDEQGGVQLTLPAGRYLLSYWPAGHSGRRGSGTPFDWPAPEGLVVEVTRPEK